jgi:hypothetical protein
VELKRSCHTFPRPVTFLIQHCIRPICVAQHLFLSVRASRLKGLGTLEVEVLDGVWQDESLRVEEHSRSVGVLAAQVGVVARNPVAHVAAVNSQLVAAASARTEHYLQGTVV